MIQEIYKYQKEVKLRLYELEKLRKLFNDEEFDPPLVRVYMENLFIRADTYTEYTYYLRQLRRMGFKKDIASPLIKPQAKVVEYSHTLEHEDIQVSIVLEIEFNKEEILRSSYQVKSVPLRKGKQR